MAVHETSKSVAEICVENDQLRKENQYLRNSLRDQFAMAALTGYMAVPDDRTYRPDRDDCKGISMEEWQQKYRKGDAIYIYQMADAMMEAREANHLAEK